MAIINTIRRIGLRLYAGKGSLAEAYRDVVPPPEISLQTNIKAFVPFISMTHERARFLSSLAACGSWFLMYLGNII